MIIKAANRLESVQEYYFSVKLRQIAEMRAAGMTILNLGIGSPDLPPAEAVTERLSQESQIAANHGYQSYKGLPELREAMALWFQKHFGPSLNPNNEILPLIGSKEGIMHIAMSFLQSGDQVLCPNPGYPSYRSASALAGAEVVDYNLSENNNWLPDLDALEKTDVSRVKIMWLNYPHMPTGVHASVDLFEKLINFAKKHQILLVNDNPYSFILNEKHLSILALPGAKEVALELSSLSKSHNMAGWRMGMLMGGSAYIETILKFKSNMDSGMFKPLQMAAIEALKLDQYWFDTLNIEYKKRQKIAFEIMDSLGCYYDKTLGGMFVWAKIPDHFTDAYELSDILLEQNHVFITPGGIFGNQGERYLRISLCSPIEQLKEALYKIGSAQLVAQR